MKFVKESRIAATPAAVFAFHEQPGALERLSPPWDRVEATGGGGSLQPGTKVTLKTYLGPIPLTWVAEHTEYDPPHKFADRQVSGPFARWYHVHHIEDDGQGGTRLRDEIDFDPPMGTLGRLLAGGFLRRKLQRTFDYRHNVTRRACEAGATDEPVGAAEPKNSSF